MGWKLLFFACAVLAIGSSGEADRGQGGGSHVHDLQKRDANSQLAFLSFAMALLNTIVNVISAVNNNMNTNMNMVMSSNKRSLERSLGDALTDWSSAAGEARSSRLEGKLKEVGEDLTARLLLGAEHWLTDKVEENPACVERILCESFKRTESTSGLAYLLFTFVNSAASGLLVELLEDTSSVSMESLTNAARSGRDLGDCGRVGCPALDRLSRTIDDWDLPIINSII